VARIDIPQATPDKRKATLTELETLDPPILTRNTIIGGDFNCIAAPPLDIRHKTANPLPSYYSNDHYQKWDSFAAGLGLTDTYRLLHGDLKGGFTRYTDSIDTRIDRVYAPRYFSTWRFVGVTADHSIFFEQAASDHPPVVCKIETPKRRLSTKLPTRVCANLFRDPKVMSYIKRI
jgi:exonuclease III